MVRILRALDPFVFKTLQRGTAPGAAHGQNVSGDAQVEQELALGRMRLAAKGRLSRRSWTAGSKIPRS